ncbi:MAG: SDR family NAD(P)-dependent oxidoreductase, partial [Mangrovicoccus sp.]
MQTTLHRARQLAAKVVRRFRRVAANFSQPSDVERLMAALPAVETSDGIKGQVVLITGSTRGVGKVIAETLAKDGARIIIHGRDGTQAQMVAQALPDTGAGPHLALAADLGTKGGAADMIAQALKLAGRIDVLIHNAAQMGPGDKFAWEIAPDHFDQVMRTNFGAVHEASSSLITHWLEAGQVGRILHISTGAAAQPSAKISGYGVSKAALESLAAHFTADLASSGIAITTVRLGSVKTDMTAAYFSWEDAEQLPPPESVMPVIQHAVTAPADSVHGRVFTSWGFNADAVSAKAMTHPAAAAPMFRYPQFEVDGEKVTRDSGRLTIYDRAENQFGPAPEVTAALQDLL